MSLSILSTQENKDRNIATFEGKLGQSVPINDQAFLRVLAVIEALIQTALQKYAAERSRQNLALTATGTDLENIGTENKVYRKAAESAVLTATIPAITDTVIPATVSFIGEPNGVQYVMAASSVSIAGVAALSLSSLTPGVSGNLTVGDSLFITNPIAGAESTATVTEVNNIGAEQEDQEVYRVRVLSSMRATRGGGNATNYKEWSEVVAGVKKAYPFSGKPFGNLNTSYPGERTIYIEATEDIDADGIAPGSLLDEVRDEVNIDSTTGLSRPPLGLINSTLYIESITRTEFFIKISTLATETDNEAQVMSEIEIALSAYFLSLTFYVEGVDLPQERNDLITNVSISEIVQTVLGANGGSAEVIVFALSEEALPLPKYRLGPGELAKLGGVTYE